MKRGGRAPPMPTSYQPPRTTHLELSHYLASSASLHRPSVSSSQYPPHQQYIAAFRREHGTPRHAKHLAEASIVSAQGRKPDAAHAICDGGADSHQRGGVAVSAG